MRKHTVDALLASPVLVGAVTVLITLSAVLMSYNANEGLPFVQTYDIKAELPSGAKLVKGNEVFAGGFRVGIVEDIEPAYRQLRGGRRAIAVVGLKLDTRVAPVPVDSRVTVRSKSSLGLKYLALSPGDSPRTVLPGEVLSLERTREYNDIEQILSTYSPRTRVGIRRATVGAGDAFVGRGTALNESIESLAPLLRHAVPVMRLLSAPETGLRDFLPQLAGTMRQLAPVARTQSALFTHMADTLAAFGEDPDALTAAIERTPPFLEAATRSLGRSRPVLARMADVMARLRPSVDEMPGTLPQLTRALDAGTPALGRSIPFAERLTAAGSAQRDLMRDPTTLMALSDIRTAFDVARPLLEYAVRPQTVCNYLNYWLTSIGDQQSGLAPGGTAQSAMVRILNDTQPNSPTSTFASRAWDLPPGQPAQDATFGGKPAGRVLHVPPSGSVVDAQGNADCRPGQLGYPNGRILEPFHRRDHQGSDPDDPNDLAFGTLPDGTPAGWNARVEVLNYPTLAGGTYVTRRLGIENLRDLP